MKNVVSAKELFAYAEEKNMAIGAFNFTNMEFVKAIVETANALETPVILQASESAIQYMGMPYVVGLMQAVSEVLVVPVAFHLDHGKNFERCKEAIDSGFSSVMIDKSQETLTENIKQTSFVVAYAHQKGVSVEAELGTLAGVEDDVSVDVKNAIYTNPSVAQEFVEKTEVDSLAVAIGTSHGLQKGKIKSPKLDIERLFEIHQKIPNMPLVLHGASAVLAADVELCNIYGGEIVDAFGITDSDIQLAIQNGVRKINIDTDLRVAFLAGLRESLVKNPESIDVRKHMMSGKKLVRRVVEQKIKMLSCRS